MTLDRYFQLPKKPEPTTAVEDHCSNPSCRRIICPTETKFSITKKGETKVYCMKCYKKILRPREDSEEAL